MQFSLRTLFYAVTWAGSLAGLVASPLRGWTVFAAGYSLACLNSMGRLKGVQTPTAQPRLFRISWLLFAASFVLPAMKGCNNRDMLGWEAAVSCGEVAVRGAMAIGEIEFSAWVAYVLLTFANVMLLLAPLFLWRLRRGKGNFIGRLFALAAATMWCVAITDVNNLNLGYYVWCAAAIVLVSAYRIQWPHLILMALGPLLTWLAR